MWKGITVSLDAGADRQQETDLLSLCMSDIQQERKLKSSTHEKACMCPLYCGYTGNSAILQGVWTVFRAGAQLYVIPSGLTQSRKSKNGASVLGLT